MQYVSELVQIREMFTFRERLWNFLFGEHQRLSLVLFNPSHSIQYAGLCAFNGQIVPFEICHDLDEDEDKSTKNSASSSQTENGIDLGNQLPETSETTIQIDSSFVFRRDAILAHTSNIELVADYDFTRPSSLAPHEFCKLV